MAARSRQASSRSLRHDTGCLRAIGKHARGGMTDAQLKSLESAACQARVPVVDNYREHEALVCEFLGIAPMGLSSVPATNPEKQTRSSRGRISP